MINSTVCSSQPLHAHQPGNHLSIVCTVITHTCKHTSQTQQVKDCTSRALLLPAVLILLPFFLFFLIVVIVLLLALPVLFAPFILLAVATGMPLRPPPCLLVVLLFFLTSLFGSRALLRLPWSRGSTLLGLWRRRHKNLTHNKAQSGLLSARGFAVSPNSKCYFYNVVFPN